MGGQRPGSRLIPNRRRSKQGKKTPVFSLFFSPSDWSLVMDLELAAIVLGAILPLYPALFAIYET